MLSPAPVAPYKGRVNVMQDCTGTALCHSIRVAHSAKHAALGVVMSAAISEWVPGSTAARPDSWPPPYADPFPGHVGAPETPAARLSPDVLGGALLHHGSLIVRNLLSPQKAEEFRLGIDAAFAARDAFHAGHAGAGEWYGHSKESAALTHVRPWIENGGGVRIRRACSRRF